MSKVKRCAAELAAQAAQGETQAVEEVIHAAMSEAVCRRYWARCPQMVSDPSLKFGELIFTESVPYLDQVNPHTFIMQGQRIRRAPAIL